MDANIDPEAFLDRLPSAGASIEAISEFALTFNGYAYWEQKAPGRRNPCGRRANETSREFHLKGSMPDDLAELRGALFFEQRRAHHQGDFSEQAVEYCRALIEKIREIADEAGLICIGE